MKKSNTSPIQLSLQTCKKEFHIEKNLTVCLDYIYEKRKIYIISSSKNLSPEWDKKLFKLTQIKALIFDKRTSKSNNYITVTDIPLKGTEGKQPVLDRPHIANIKTYSLATAFKYLGTNIVDIVYLSESKYLESIIKTAIATDAIRHIKYVILKISKSSLSSYSQLLFDNGMTKLNSQPYNENYDIHTFTQVEMNLHKEIIQMDYVSKFRRQENFPIQFSNTEAEQLMYEVYLHKYLTQELLIERFYKWILSPTIICPTFRRFGKPYDGGWDVCLSYNLIHEDDCKVYSFGINNDFSFDDAISKEKGCTVRSFDPSMKNVTEKRSELVSFYRMGLSGADFSSRKHWTMHTWKSFKRLFNDEDRVIDFFKFDIEGSEWSMLETALLDGSLKNVKQIAFEIHGVGSPYAPLIKHWRVLKRLESQGFLRWQTHINAWTMNPNEYSTTRVHCMELYYINANRIGKHM